MFRDSIMIRFHARLIKKLCSVARAQWHFVVAEVKSKNLKIRKKRGCTYIFIFPVQNGEDDGRE